VLHSFGNGSDGIFPLGGIVFDSSGNRFGVTADGGHTGVRSAGGWLRCRLRDHALAWE
jgi:hypothetical protein